MQLHIREGAGGERPPLDVPALQAHRSVPDPSCCGSSSHHPQPLVSRLLLFKEEVPRGACQQNHQHPTQSVQYLIWTNITE